MPARSRGASLAAVLGKFSCLAALGICLTIWSEHADAQNVTLTVYAATGDTSASVPLNAQVPWYAHMKIEDAMKAAFAANILYVAKWGGKMQGGTVIDSYFVESINGVANFTHPYDASLSRYWLACVNGAELDEGITKKELNAGDAIKWFYIGWRQGFCQ
jgi:hypothetical protein